MRRKGHDIRIPSGNVGSLGGLMALRKGTCHLAGSHLLDTETGEYNISYIKRYLKGVKVVVGAYQMVRAVTPYMKKQGKGAIVNDSSIGGVTGVASSIPYAASKAALNLMTKSLAHVLAPEIRINAVVPGMIQTRWLKSGMGDEQYEAMIRTQGEQLPLKKVAPAEDIAKVLVWFLTDPDLITGETLIVDSGIHIGKLPPYSSGDSY